MPWIQIPTCLPEPCMGLTWHTGPAADGPAAGGPHPRSATLNPTYIYPTYLNPEPCTLIGRTLAYWTSFWWVPA